MDRPITPTLQPNPCENLSGALEMQILVGPAEAVGLEPVAVGSIPFSVTTGNGAYLVQGNGPIAYEAQLQEAWGTYTVTLDMDAEVTGECLASEMLDLTVTASGNQMVEVRAEGFSGDYPWEGTQTLNLSFPLEEGVSVEGEGWIFILHLTQ